MKMPIGTKSHKVPTDQSRQSFMSMPLYVHCKTNVIFLYKNSPLVYSPSENMKMAKNNKKKCSKYVCFTVECIVLIIVID